MRYIKHVPSYTSFYNRVGETIRKNTLPDHHFIYQKMAHKVENDDCRLRETFIFNTLAISNKLFHLVLTEGGVEKG